MNVWTDDATGRRPAPWGNGNRGKFSRAARKRRHAATSATASPSTGDAGKPATPPTPNGQPGAAALVAARRRFRAARQHLAMHEIGEGLVILDQADSLTAHLDATGRTVIARGFNAAEKSAYLIYEAIPGGQFEIHLRRNHDG